MNTAIFTILHNNFSWRTHGFLNWRSFLTVLEITIYHRNLPFGGRKHCSFCAVTHRFPVHKRKSKRMPNRKNHVLKSQVSWMLQIRRATATKAMRVRVWSTCHVSLLIAKEWDKKCWIWVRPYNKINCSSVPLVMFFQKCCWKFCETKYNSSIFQKLLKNIF